MRNHTFLPKGFRISASIFLKTQQCCRAITVWWKKHSDQLASVLSIERSPVNTFYLDDKGKSRGFANKSSIKWCKSRQKSASTINTPYTIPIFVKYLQLQMHTSGVIFQVQSSWVFASPPPCPVSKSSVFTIWVRKKRESASKIWYVKNDQMSSFFIQHLFLQDVWREGVFLYLVCLLRSHLSCNFFQWPDLCVQSF